MRRAGVLSLLVALFALAGASVAPTRLLTGTHATAIVWEARSPRQAPVIRHARHRVPIAIAGATPRSGITSTFPASSLVRHALFQRPPPQQTSL
jgi:hypothetical protein